MLSVWPFIYQYLWSFIQQSGMEFIFVRVVIGFCYCDFCQCWTVWILFVRVSEISIFPLRFNFRLDLFNRTKAGSQKAPLAKRTLVKSCVAGFTASTICVLHTFIMNITTPERKVHYTKSYSADPARLSLVVYIYILHHDRQQLLSCCHASVTPSKLEK